MFINREYPAAFMLKHMTKDLKLSNEEIENRKLSLPLIEDTTRSYSEALEEGYGEQDMSAIFEILSKKND
ncbi:NAD-binding protein [Leptotrichia wadei]|jgi:possible hydroxyacid dehydrogenase|uniref:NAD-binding protein n=1 Tax=Leptotrichia wadei TaxID=157687 RepID=UPI0028EA806B|nr:NAD-binding protein [Leptotrichia wadei]